MPEPEGFGIDGLEGCLVDEVLGLGSRRGHRCRREGVVRLADERRRLPKGEAQLRGVARDEGVTRKRDVARVVRCGVAVRARAVAGPCRRRDLALGIQRRVVGRRVAQVGLQRVVRAPVIGHPVERVLQVLRHARAESDDEDLVARVGQLLGPEDGEAPALVHVGPGFAARAGAGIGVGAVGEQDHELLPAVLRRVGGLVGVEIGLHFLQGIAERCAPAGRLHGKGCAITVVPGRAGEGARAATHIGVAVHLVVVCTDGPLDHLISGQGVECRVLGASESHVAEADIEACLVEAVNFFVGVVVEEAENGPLGDGDAPAVHAARSVGTGTGRVGPVVADARVAWRVPAHAPREIDDEHGIGCDVCEYRRLVGPGGRRGEQDRESQNEKKKIPLCPHGAHLLVVS